MFQFTTSIVLIICRQMDYILRKKIGLDKKQVVSFQGANTLGDQVKTFKNELLNLSEVKFAAISDFLPLEGLRNE